MKFSEELHKQRWDDHRFYHHNRVNQLLHLLSASFFVASYYLIFVDPVLAVMVGWLLAMLLRQIGHFFFEPKSFDEVNGVSHDYKESVKVGYNLRRKVLMAYRKWRYGLKHVHPTFYIGGAAAIAPDLRADAYSYIATGCRVGPGVNLGKYVMLGPHVAILGNDHQFDKPGVPIIFSGRPEFKQTYIEDDAWLGGGPQGHTGFR